MKINDVSRTGAINHYRKNNDNNTANNVGKKDKVKEEVKISPEAKELLDAQAAANTSNRGQLVQGLKQSVDNGTYHVPTPDLADKLLPYLK
jgi:negative regulator of flagellin synthesis FlgM